MRPIVFKNIIKFCSQKDLQGVFMHWSQKTKKEIGSKSSAPFFLWKMDSNWNTKSLFVFCVQIRQCICREEKATCSKYYLKMLSLQLYSVCIPPPRFHRINYLLQWNWKKRLNCVLLWFCHLPCFHSKFSRVFQWQAFRKLLGNYPSWCFYTT